MTKKKQSQASPRKTTFRPLKALLDKSYTPEELARIDEQVRQELLEMDLKELRELAKVPQTTVAASLETTQGQVSRIEARDDHLVSTLRKYVEALGGTLEVVARFDDRTIRLKSV
jgi:hypothetical protein